MPYRKTVAFYPGELKHICAECGNNFELLSFESDVVISTDREHDSITVYAKHPSQLFKTIVCIIKHLGDSPHPIFGDGQYSGFRSISVFDHSYEEVSEFPEL